MSNTLGGWRALQAPRPTLCPLSALCPSPFLEVGWNGALRRTQAALQPGHGDSSQLVWGKQLQQPAQRGIASPAPCLAAVVLRLCAPSVAHGAWYHQWCSFVLLGPPGVPTGCALVAGIRPVGERRGEFLIIINCSAIFYTDELGSCPPGTGR